MRKIHQIRGYIQSMYLVEYDHGLLLLDSGCRCDVPIVKEFITQKLNRSWQDLKLVVATHAHPDHSGGAFYYQQAGVKIAGPKKLNHWYRGPRGVVVYIIDIILTYMVAMKVRRGEKLKKILFPRKIHFDYHVKEGDSLPGFPDWQVLECPGHTACDISLWHSATALAYTADNIIAKKKEYVPPYPINFPKKYIRTLRRYQTLGIEHFLLAHYDKHKLTIQQLDQLIAKAPDNYRSHSNTLPIIFTRLLRALLRI